MTANNKNLFLALILSLAVFIGWDALVIRPQLAKQSHATKQSHGKVTSPATQEAQEDTKAILPRAQALATSPRIPIKSATLQGSLALRGARLDDLILLGYRETLQKNSPFITLLSPSQTASPYFLYFGWAGQNLALPDQTTVWTADRNALTPQTPVTLSWTNPQGIRFTQTLTLDTHYMITVAYGVHNPTHTPISVLPYGLISRQKPDKNHEPNVGSEGAVGAFNGTLKEVHYNDLEDKNATQSLEGDRSWLGFSDKYWLTAIIPDQAAKVQATLRNVDQESQRYQADVQLPSQTIAPGQTQTATVRFFAGAKDVETINGYQRTVGITLFDRAIDWGLFWFLTKPFFIILHWLYGIFGNFGLAIIGLTVIIKAALFPLALKGYQSMSRMKILQPKIKSLQERYKDDKLQLQQAQIELFRKEKINPLGGCLPLILQFPVFFALYKVLFISLEMRHQPFIGWIRDLSAPDPLTPINLFGLLPFTPPVFLAVGILPILYAVTFHFQMKLQPQTSLDPMQQKVFAYMPWIFMFMFSGLSSGLVLYWTVSNILSIFQQWVFNRLDDKHNLAVAPTP